MPAKVKEMDNIMKDIYANISLHNNSRTLFVMCSDHGMNEVPIFAARMLY